MPSKGLKIGGLDVPPSRWRPSVGTRQVGTCKTPLFLLFRKIRHRVWRHGSSDRRLSLPLQARADGPARWAYSDEAGLPRGELGRSSRVSSRCRTRTRTRTRIPRCGCGGGCCGPRLLPRGAPHARGQREESTRTRRSATTRLAIAHAASRTHAAHARTGTAGASETEVHAGCGALGRDVAHAAARERRARHAGEGARARRRRAPRSTHIRVL